MPFGNASRTQIVVLALLLLVAAWALSGIFFGKSPAPAPATSASTTAAKPPTSATRAGRRGPQRKPQLVASLDPALRFDLLNLGESQPYEGTKRDIFSARPVEIPKPIDAGIKEKNPTPVVYTPPPPPPIPLKFYGFTTQQGQAKRVFLSSGDDVFVGTEGQVINKRYRIVKVNNSSVEIEDILNNNKEVIPLTSPS